MYRCRGYNDIQPRDLVSPDDARRFPSIALNFLFRNDVTINARGFIAPQFRGVISSYARSLVTALSSPFVARAFRGVRSSPRNYDRCRVRFGSEMAYRSDATAW